MRALAFAAACAVLAGGAAHAQLSRHRCRGRVYLDAITANRQPNGRFEYSAVIRNATEETVRFTVSFGNLPADVTLNQHLMPLVTRKPEETAAMKFASGSNARFDAGTVKFLYDTTRSVRPYIALRSCLAN